jgi:hypothetical protein
MLDLSNAPAFLIEHLVIYYAADGEFGMFFDGIIFRFSSPPSPSMRWHQSDTLANASAQREFHGSTLDVERLVIFDHTQSLVDVNL